MTCEELRDDYELYALGTLEGEERDEISRHLARGCDNCTEGVRRASLVNAWIATSAPEVAPPARLRRRVREIAGVERPRYASWHWAWAALCAALIAIAVYLGSEVRRSSAELADARKKLRETVAESAAGRQLLELLNAPETKRVSFGEAQPRPPRGTVFVNARAGVLLVASNLPVLPAGKTFEFWVIPKGGAPKPAGLFRGGANGTATHLVSGPVDPNTAAVAVSVEPESGSNAPTTTPIVVAPVAAP